MGSEKHMAAIKKAITKLPDELGDSLTQAQGNITVNSLQAMFQTQTAKLENMLAAQHHGTNAIATAESATPCVTDGMLVWKMEDHMLYQKVTFSRKGRQKTL